jgi:invasion protein IalB
MKDLIRLFVAGIVCPAALCFSLTANAQNKPTPPASGNAAKSQAAQTAPAAPAASNPATVPQASNASANQAPGWTARCFSPARQSPLECTLEQQVIVQQTGQQVSFVSIRVPGDTKQPVMMVQLPLGLFLPAGLTLQVDEGKSQVVAIQSCDQRACYVGMPLTAELLDGMKKGQRLSLGMQSMNREPVTIAHPLGDFASQYQKIQ